MALCGRESDGLDQSGSSLMSSFCCSSSLRRCSTSHGRLPSLERLQSPGRSASLRRLPSLGRLIRRGSSSGDSSSGSSLPERMNVLQIYPSREDERRDEIMFVIYVCQSRYDIRAFNQSGKQMHKLCFTIDLDTISLPFYSGFAILGSTLYMIGGDTFSASATPSGRSRTRQVSTLNTYEINLDMISRFRNNSRGVLDFVKPGPRLNAEKRFPIVIVVASRIYAFSRFFSPAKSLQNFEFLDTTTGVVPEWIGLPEPPFEANSDIMRIEYTEIVSHVVDEEQSGIIVCLSYESYNQVCRLDLKTHEWSVLSSGIDPSFCGKVVSLSGVNYALKNSLKNSPVYQNDRVCFFRDIMSPNVEVVTNLPTSPAVVSWHRQSEMGLIGDTLFLARIGFRYPRDPDGTVQDYHLTLDKFQISKKAGTTKAVNFSRKIFKLENTGFKYDWRTLYCVSWVRGSATRATDRAARATDWERNCHIND